MAKTSAAAGGACDWIQANSPFALSGTALAVGALAIAGPIVLWLLRSSASGSKTAKRKRSGPKCALDSENYVKCKLLALAHRYTRNPLIVCNCCSYRFRLPKQMPLNLPIGKHVLVRATVGTRVAVRSYTPVSSPDSVGYFELLVKTYPQGCISRYLSEMQPDEMLDVKGPKGNFEYEKGMVDHVGMVAGGTGLTPMYQIIRHILKDPTDATTMSLVYANVNEDDILLRPELEALAAQHPTRFAFFCTLDNPPTGWEQGKGFVSAAMIKQHLPKPGPRTKIFVCGPPPMVSSVSSHCEALGYGPAKTSPDSAVYKF